jgi:hypothetical protein
MALAARLEVVLEWANLRLSVDMDTTIPISEHEAIFANILLTNLLLLANTR